MRYPPDQKTKARAALIDAGARALKTSGFKGIGVDGLAAAAGVTSGAFYSNFANKEEMLEAVVDAFVGEPFLSDTETGTVAEKRARLLRLLDEYISTGHCADPASGCVMPALSSDVARAQPPVKEAYERQISTLAHRVAGLLEGKRSDREQRAWSLVALMVGAVTISRAMTEHGEARTAAITAAHRTAAALVG
jgi:TetR/AcrR family transcriptional regulator, transcriptional repressor for nem operon